MCYEEGNKLRMYFNNKAKGVQTNQPLIKDKKTMPDLREKQNEKYNMDFHSKTRTLPNNEFTSTMEYEGSKFVNNFVNAPYNHSNFVTQDRYAYQPNQNHFMQTTTKTLTFGNVKTTSNKLKEGGAYQQQSSFINVPEVKRPLQIVKNTNPTDKEKVNTLTERSEKPLIERVAQKKEKAVVKVVAAVKPAPQVAQIAQISQIAQIDDFTCTQELQFKPVEKKSLIPEKKYTADKTTSKFDFAKPKKIVQKRNDQKELKQFDGLEKTINMTNDGEALMLICQKQEEYAVDPGYLEKNQKNLTWWSRAILVDWMRHISFEFSLQRDTYQIAVVLLDNYLARTTAISKSVLQAIGVTTLFIASKLEEFQCKQSREFVKSTNNCCSVQDIHELQIKIVKCLKFRLNPPTLYSLSNKTMSQWDIFLQENDYAKNHPLFNNHSRVFFKQLDENSYKMFRELTQLIDCSIIDIQTVQYKPRMLICSFLYLLIGQEMGIFNSKEIVMDFPGSSLYLVEENPEYNDLFRSFVEHVFGFSLFDILPTVQYCATYFDLVYTFEKPMISQEDLESMSLEEYCSYQTFNGGMMKIIKNRYRGLY